MISRSQRSQGTHPPPLIRSLLTGSRQPRVELPTPLTSFVGRTREIATIHALLQQAGVRLVTLTGPGGVGKTRVAIRVAEESAGDFSDGILFVSLAELRDPGLLARTVAASLGLTEVPTQDAAATVSAFLREQSYLLILDNIEHLLPAVAPVVSAWLSQCRSLSVMATSRSTLHISGEHVVSITPLEVPAQADHASLEQLGSVPSIQLFVDRAKAAHDGFALTPAIAADVAALCERLEGVPLAIELAAARMQLLPPGALLARLDRRLPILIGGPVDQPARLQTMERAISWSYALLTPDEQRLFRRLAVFAGGFSIEGAEAVNSGDSNTLDAIGSLMAKSLLFQDHRSHDEPRYRILETIREFGLERLEEQGEIAEMRNRHALHFVDLAELADPAIWGGKGHRMWLDRLEGDLANLRAALSWLRDAGNGAAFLRLAAALGGLWQFRSHRVEGREWLVQALAYPGRDAQAARAVALIKHVILDRGLGLPVQPAMLEEALAIRQELRDDRGIAAVLLQYSWLAAQAGNDDEAARLRAEAAAYYMRARGPDAIGWCRLGDGNAALKAGDIDAARQCFEDALAMFKREGFSYGMTTVVLALARLEASQGSITTSAACFQESLALWSETRSRECLLDTVTGAALLAARSGKPARAARLLGFVATLRLMIGYAGLPDDQRAVEDALPALRAALDDPGFRREWSAGQALAIDAAIIEARSLLDQLASMPAHQPQGSQDRPAGLTRRELDVLQLIAAGHTNREISEALFISQTTAISHVHNILAKLELDSRSAAAAWAVRQGLD